MSAPDENDDFFLFDDDLTGLPPEFPAYVPSLPELELLGRHWFMERYDRLLFCWLYSYGINASDHAAMMYANLRLSRMQEVVGPEIFSRVVEETEKECQRRYGKAWEAYLRRDEEWRINNNKKMSRDSSNPE